MKVMVTGARGQLGQEITAQLRLLRIPCFPVDVEDFDLCDGQAVMAFVRSAQPDAIIHCAAYTAVDLAEQEPGKCCRINAIGTLNLVRAALSVGAKLCYISTEYVFPGEGFTPYETTDRPRPLNVYGLSKLQGEEAVRSLMSRYFIVRISWLYGMGKNFVRTMLRLGQERSSVRVVCDQVGSPTYAADLAPLLCRMIQTDRYGIYHATNEGECSWDVFARSIFAGAGLRCKVESIPSSAYPTPAQRPLNSRLSKKSLVEAGFSLLPSWEDALERYLARLKAQREQ